MRNAEQTSLRWRSGTLFSYRQQSEPTTRTTVFFGLGIALASVALLVLLASGFGWSAIFLGAGGYVLVRKVIVIVALSRAYDAEQAENDHLLVAENNAYAEWFHTLSDRPTDAEMARWLDLDKSYLTTIALHRCWLTKSDLVTHVVMTERKEGARRARVVHGRPRYSAYVVLVFLLTGSGVREIEVDLEFCTGEARDERRTSFRYDALASARVSETGVRVANDRAYLALPPGQPEPLEILKLRSREFRLTLLNGEDIRVVVENFKGFTDVSLENEPYLLRIALHTSGIAGALHVLETVAAEGRDWIGREQERRRHRSPEWFVGDSKQKSPGSAALGVSTSELPNQNSKQATP